MSVQCPGCRRGFTGPQCPVCGTRPLSRTALAIALAAGGLLFLVYALMAINRLVGMR